MEPKPAYIANQANPPSLNRQAQQADQQPYQPSRTPYPSSSDRQAHPSALHVALSSTSGRTRCGVAHVRPMGQAPRVIPSQCAPVSHPEVSSRGKLRTMCGSRTGGWSLPCVMSD
jgi:hypothetical protein